MLYRFQIQLSDIDRGVYETLDFRIAQHQSETLTYLLTRVLAYSLSYREGIEFPPGGLSEPENPGLWVKDSNGNIDLWIEIGNPSTKKLHRASKAADEVVVYTYKTEASLHQQVNVDEIHKAENIKLIAIDSKFLDRLEPKIEKNNSWSIMHQQGQVDVGIATETFMTELKPFSLVEPT